ncbi:hemerythrin domain-containing protein [Anaeromyxobacter oryzisoli]|uniref:hemerythrin domain-containing protein n=1 Tax=Anaeromyxobacter oryzisoli TaxID=2925408 RepID=UPI001F588617|nr:hemerythrin domain-containing protein [Anaeromyxobacter sp. SG63]
MSMPTDPAEPRGPLGRYLAADHARLDALLARAAAIPGEVDRPAYDAFRAGLLRHIALEEKILFPAAVEARGGQPLPDQRRLRVDHGAIASLLVPSPTPELIRELHSILEPHDRLEEGQGHDAGVYAQCDALLADRAEELVARMDAYPPVRVAAHYDGPRAVRTAAEALRISALQAARR